MGKRVSKSTEIGGVNMPNIKSSKKDVVSSKIAYEKNKAAKTALKTNKTIRELVLEEGIMDEAKLDEVLDPYHLTVPGAGLL